MRQCPTVLLLFVILLPIVSNIVNAKRSNSVKKDTVRGYNTKVRRKKRFRVVTGRGKTELDRLGDTLVPKRAILGGERPLTNLGINFKRSYLWSEREKPTSNAICEEDPTGGGGENAPLSFFNKLKRGMKKYANKVSKFLQEDNMLNFLWVYKNVFCKKKIILLTFFVMIHSAIISIIIPRCDNLIFQDVSNRRFDHFGGLLLNCFLVRVINMCLCGLRNYIFMVTSAHSVKEVKRLLFQVYINKDNEYDDQMDHSEIVNRITLETHDFADIIPYYINPFIRNFFSIIFNFAYMFYLNYKLSGVIMGCFLISSLLTIISTKLKKRRIKSINKEKSRSTKISLEALNNINVIKLFSTELYECGRYSQSLSEILRLQIRKERFNLVHMVVSKLFVLETYILILLKGETLLRGNEIDRNTFTSFFFYINNIYSYIDILDYYMDICNIVNQYRHIIGLIGEEAQREGGNVDPSDGGENKKHVQPSQRSSSDCVSCPSPNKAAAKGISLQLDTTADSSQSDVVLQFKVFCKYKNTDNYVLKNLNFKILKNTNNVILGRSGGGKSTLHKLMLNFYKCSKGKVYLYNKPISHYSGKEIMNTVSYVQQDSKLLKGTIKENLTHCITDDCTNFDMLDLINISKCCTCHEYISKLRKRYETIISNRTELLTTSQKQKICIARELARSPKILLLDESTSAVDRYNERVIFQNMRQKSLFKNLTIIRITHKKANLDLADNIFVLKGRPLWASFLHRHHMCVHQGRHFAVAKYSL
ncbi:hypothetical protein C922_02449 [Plasmodium inui San Antonio 1]|uniref:ABC transporter B family member 3 n=1 Tax=Plasmodium inui San Antonio 1 TaxID=1237626 RepID=W7ADY3_9APIC|nr:hypothetical protein C922_02449 [Plasmodium inui San Antonio 1]EUD67299.1 hypothetical protein C922_02449 [Plasmodium inui San Antonio 1]